MIWGFSLLLGRLISGEKEKGMETSQVEKVAVAVFTVVVGLILWHVLKGSPAYIGVGLVAWGGMRLLTVFITRGGKGGAR